MKKNLKISAKFLSPIFSYFVVSCVSPQTTAEPHITQELRIQSPKKTNATPSESAQTRSEKNSKIQSPQELLDPCAFHLVNLGQVEWECEDYYASLASMPGEDVESAAKKMARGKSNEPPRLTKNAAGGDAWTFGYPSGRYRHFFMTSLPSDKSGASILGFACSDSEPNLKNCLAIFSSLATHGAPAPRIGGVNPKFGKECQYNEIESNQIRCESTLRISWAEWLGNKNSRDVATGLHQLVAKATRESNGTVISSEAPCTVVGKSGYCQLHRILSSRQVLRIFSGWTDLGKKGVLIFCSWDESLDIRAC